MMSPIHQIINEIRIQYAGCDVSQSDISDIESRNKICSIVNFRNTTTAFLRITSYSTNDNVFEDIVFDYSILTTKEKKEEKLFRIVKQLYNMAYGVNLIKSTKSTITDFEDSKRIADGIDYEKEQLKKRCISLEKKVALLEGNNSVVDLLDYIK